MPETKDQYARLVEEFPDSVSLTKNSKGYTWEIKLRGREGQINETIDRLVEVNNRMKLIFGEQ